VLDTKATSSTTRQLCHVTDRREIGPGLVVLRFRNPTVARSVRAGQFVNILPRSGAYDPLLRRPFSVYNVLGDEAEVIIQAVGRGTDLIASTQIGQTLDVLGPLGNPWNFNSTNFKSAILVIGGAGVASMPLLTHELKTRGIPPVAYYGARSKNLFASEWLGKVHYATDDGSLGFHGTNIQLLDKHLSEKLYVEPKLFVCGPTGMMRAASSLADRYGIPCELSLETEMACGIGICQGCPVRTDEETFSSSGKRFRLACVEGPSFMSDTIVI